MDEIQYRYRVKRDDINERRVAPEDRNSLYFSFYDVLNGILCLGNADAYVAGDNSKMLSDDSSDLDGFATIMRWLLLIEREQPIGRRFVCPEHSSASLT